MNDPSNADRLKAMAALLEKEGIGFDGVAVAGAAGDVAVVRTRDIDADRLGAIARRIKALGFRYVTIDLERQAGGSP
jgi:hypothetical protein